MRKTLRGRVRGRIRVEVNGETWIIELRPKTVYGRRLRKRDGFGASTVDLVDFLTGQKHLPLFGGREP